MVKRISSAIFRIAGIEPKKGSAEKDRKVCVPRDAKARVEFNDATGALSNPSNFPREALLLLGRLNGRRHKAVKLRNAPSEWACK